MELNHRLSPYQRDYLTTDIPSACMSPLYPLLIYLSRACFCSNKKQSEWRDLNPRPSGPKPDALPLRYTPNIVPFQRVASRQHLWLLTMGNKGVLNRA